LETEKLIPAVLALFYTYGRTDGRSYFNRNPSEEGKCLTAPSGLLSIVLETEKLIPAVVALFYAYGRTDGRSYFNRNPSEEG